jgi:hypothetical protein
MCSFFFYQNKIAIQQDLSIYVHSTRCFEKSEPSSFAVILQSSSLLSINQSLFQLHIGWRALLGFPPKLPIYPAVGSS